jgi:hypothetical protein
MTLDTKVRLLRHAIENAMQARATVRDLTRIFCPHILGKKNGCWCTAVWQFGGYSTIGNLPNWRCFELAEFTSIEIRHGQWHRGFRRRRPEEFAFDLVDTIAGAEHCGDIRAVSPGFVSFRKLLLKSGFRATAG